MPHTKFVSLSQVMDVIAVEEHPLLLNHCSGINPIIIDSLLLPSQFQLKIAMNLQIYFAKRNANAQYPGLLEENSVTKNSFSARFAANNSEMQRVRQEILATADARIEEKRTEWRNAREKVEEMRNRASRMNHQYKNRIFCSVACSKCSLESAISDYTIRLYERPLKPEAHNQNAVVFELLMPSTIECLRDVLYLFVARHYNASRSKIRVHGEWNEYGRMSRYARSKPRNVFLGSTTTLVETSHYGRGHHPDNPFSAFVVDNGHNCTFNSGSYALPIEMSKQSVKEYVSFSVENATAYSGLQWTLHSTLHTQNSVLAK